MSTGSRCLTTPHIIVEGRFFKTRAWWLRHKKQSKTKKGKQRKELKSCCVGQTRPLRLKLDRRGTVATTGLTGAGLHFEVLRVPEHEVNFHQNTTTLTYPRPKSIPTPSPYTHAPRSRFCFLCPTLVMPGWIDVNLSHRGSSPRVSWLLLLLLVRLCRGHAGVGRHHAHRGGVRCPRRPLSAARAAARHPRVAPTLLLICLGVGRRGRGERRHRLLFVL